MKREEIAAIVAKSLRNVHVGDVFSTQTGLYRALEIPLEKCDGNKTIRSVVSQYFSWESCGPSKSKKIRITSITENPDLTDGRKNNGGAHNNKYIEILKPILAQCEYPELITYRQISDGVYGIPQSCLSYAKGDNKYVAEYKWILYQQIKARTQGALDALSREGVLAYKEVSVINKLENCSDMAKLTVPLDLETPLLSFLTQLYGEKKANILLHRLNEIINDCISSINIKRTEEGAACLDKCDLNAVTVFEFADIVRGQAKISDCVKSCLFEHEHTHVHKSSIANAPEDIIIKKVSTDVQGRLYQNKRRLSLQEQRNVYRASNPIYWLLGWKAVYKALNIVVFTDSDSYKSYSSKKADADKFKRLLDTYMISQVTEKKIFNPYENEKAKRETKKPAFGRYGRIIVQRDEDIYYLASNPAVNKLHCRIFGYSPNEKFFSKFLPETKQ